MSNETCGYSAVLIAFDETEFWNMEMLPHSHLIDKIIGVYLFDDTARHYCCSATAMVWLDELRNVALVSEDATDEQREEIREIVGGTFSDEFGHYRTAREVRRYREENPNMVVGPDEFESFEDALDWHQGNHELF